MEKIIIEPEARFKFERLCDSLHPEEVGGQFYGLRDGDHTIIKDVLPVPNISTKKNTTYIRHSWGDHWASMYGKTVQLDKLGKFHSHPTGAIPSTQDMKACPGLHLWLIHHRKGEHTFLAARDYVNREVVLINEPHAELNIPHIRGDKLILGHSFVDSSGIIQTSNSGSKIFTLKNETRRILILALQNSRYRNDVNLKEVVRRSGRTRSTVRKHLNLCREAGLLTYGWSNRNYKIKEECFA